MMRNGCRLNEQNNKLFETFICQCTATALHRFAGSRSTFCRLYNQEEDAEDLWQSPNCGPPGPTQHNSTLVRLQPMTHERLMIHTPPRGRGIDRVNHLHATCNNTGEESAQVSKKKAAAVHLAPAQAGVKRSSIHSRKHTHTHTQAYIHPWRRVVKLACVAHSTARPYLGGDLGVCVEKAVQTAG